MTHPRRPHGQRQRPNHHGRPPHTPVRVVKRPPATLPVIKKVHYQRAAPTPPHRPGHLSPSVIGLIASVGLGAVALAVAGSCNSAAQALPCPVPTDAAATPVPNAPPITCTTSHGSHYIWVHGGGGWVPSRDGLHPNPGASGIGEDDGGGRAGGKGKGGSGGVGDGHGGGGHGGGDGG
ncbi:MAG: hypothetical protein H0X24_22595 [Ktedonobacterales bacterium]|nr:hypothetical protein [Ktedonobacterales bacterium]